MVIYLHWNDVLPLMRALEREDILHVLVWIAFYSIIPQLLISSFHLLDSRFLLPQHPVIPVPNTLMKCK